MLLSKELEGSTVERVYWSVVAQEWLPVIGKPFDSLQEAHTNALRQMDQQGTNTVVIINRIVFRKPDGVKVDMELARERKFR